MCLGIVRLNNEAGVICGVAAVKEVFHGISSLLHSGQWGKHSLFLYALVWVLRAKVCRPRNQKLAMISILFDSLGLVTIPIFGG